MGNGWMELLKRVTIFMLAGQVILHFLPSGGYEKYVKMVVSIMILSQIAVPVLSVGSFDAERIFDQALTEYEAEMERIEEQVGGAGLEGTDYAAAGLSEAVQEKLSSCAGELGVAIRLVSYSDKEGRLTLHVAEGRAEEADRDSIRIEKIAVGEEKADASKTDGQGKTEELKQAFAKALELDAGQLEVIWDE